MSAPTRNVERLDLKFRAVPSHASVPGGWALWCLVGMAIGTGFWWLGREYLAERLSRQLSDSDPATAMLAVEALVAIESDISLDVVKALQHPDRQVAQAAYRALDTQLTRWQREERGIATSRMQDLVQRLQALPTDTPDNNLVLASSLASRVYAICLQYDEPELASLIAECKKVFGRMRPLPAPAVADEAVIARIEAQLASINGSHPHLTAPGEDPPGPNPRVFEATGVSSSLSDSGEGGDLDSGNLDQAHVVYQGMVQAPQGMVPGIAAREAVHRSTSTPLAQLKFLRASSIRDAATDSIHLEPDDGSIAIPADNHTEALPEGSRPAPALIKGSASVEARALAELSSSATRVVRGDADGLSGLTIDQLVRLLASQEPGTAQAAALELRAKGMPDDRLVLASELASGTTEERLALIERIAVRADLDPRPWLLWMAEDGQSLVRRRAIALLSSMSDLDVQQRLRGMLSEEADQLVAGAIRQVLSR